MATQANYPGYISVDTVYQKVLMFANKEQRGYITPQEFNLFADMAQMEIFEQYFYDLDQRLRSNSNSDEYANVRNNIQEKITKFETSDTGTGAINGDQVYRLGSIRIGAVGESREVEEVQQKDLIYILRGPLTKPTSKRPIYVRSSSSIAVYPENVSFTYNYIRRPNKPNWTYVVVNERPMWDPSNSSMRHFELHSAEESELVYKILKFAGVSMRRDDIMKAGQGMEISQIQQEKQ